MSAKPSLAPEHNAASVVDELLGRAIAARATDVHFEPVDCGLLVRARVDGQLLDLDSLPPDVAGNIVSRLKVLASLLTYRVDIPQEGGVVWRRRPSVAPIDAFELRVATFPTVRGERAVVRVFASGSELCTLDSLGLLDTQAALLREAIARPTGLIVVAGPAGSGKTTTLYALVREVLDRTPGRSVITLEDPVEQRIDRVTQIQINPHGELGYERCMRSLLRQDPQVILLGEVRDRQTASVAIEAALTGHLILTTVHSGDPAETIVRFLEMGIPAYQLTSALTLICSQRLLRKTCRSCSPPEQAACDMCLGTGYAGRVAVAHLTSVDEPLRSEILRHATASELREQLQACGPDLFDRAAELADSGETDEPEVLRVLGQRPAA